MSVIIDGLNATVECEQDVSILAVPNRRTMVGSVLHGLSA